jgi:hypothetical protein
MLEQLIQGALFVFSNDNDDRDPTKVARRLLAFGDEVYGGVRLSI